MSPKSGCGNELLLREGGETFINSVDIIVWLVA